METEKSRTGTEASGCDCDGRCEVCTCRQQNPSHRRKQTTLLLAVLVLLVILLVSTGLVFGQGVRTSGAGGKPGLLIIAHGSPSPKWNKPVLALEKNVTEILGNENPFAKVKVVFMEFAEPNVADGIAELEQADCDRIVAVPLLVAPSSHSHWDIPALLGIYSNPEIEKMLLEEGAKLLRSKVPITLTTTMSDSDVIEKIMLKRVSQLSSDPNNEAIIVLAHGSEAIPPSWDRLMRRTVTYACGRTGISYGDWACVGVGQEYGRAVAAIQEAAEHREHVIVVGAYLSLGVERVHQRWKDRTDKQPHMPGFENPLEGLSIRLSDQGLLPDEAVAQWIAATAKDEITRHP